MQRRIGSEKGGDKPFNPTLLLALPRFEPLLLHGEGREAGGRPPHVVRVSAGDEEVGHLACILWQPVRKEERGV
jgi:hypothetical protein